MSLGKCWGCHFCEAYMFFRIIITYHLQKFIHWKENDKWFFENENFFQDQAKLDTLKTWDLAKIICMTMENMNTVPTMPFIGDNVEFQGKTRSFVSCDPLRNMDLSAWSRSGPSGKNFGSKWHHLILSAYTY